MDIRDQLLDSYNKGELFITLEKVRRSPDVEKQVVVQELVNLHKDGSINLIDSFLNLKSTEAGITFFSLRNVFEKALPELKNGVLAVMRCVQHLVREAGQDLAAGSTVDYFIEFLANHPGAPDEALAIIDKDPELVDLLPAALIAGSRLDTQKYIRKAVALMEHDIADTRRQVIFALRRLDWTDDKTLLEIVYSALECVLDSEMDDSVLATIANTAASLMKHDLSQKDRLIALIESAIDKGEHQAIYVASCLLASVDRATPRALIEKLLHQTKRVNVEHKGTIKQIDYGLHRLIAIGMDATAIQFLENIIEENGTSLEPDTFDLTLNDIRNKSNLLNKLMTRWLLNGNSSLCHTAAFLVGRGQGANLTAEVDSTEIDINQKIDVVFIARKAAGYLFMNPISAASILLSLLDMAQDKHIRAEVGRLLLDPILINYPGNARNFVNEKRELCSPEAQDILCQIDTAIEEYFAALRSIESLPELHPSESQREAYYRHNSRLMAESFEEAERKSVFLGLVTKQTILYGRSSINYIEDGQGNAHRQEILLQEHSVEFEIARLIQLDPIGLECQLAVYKSEVRKV